MEIPLQSSKILSPGEEKAIDKKINELKDIRDGVELMQGVNYETKDKAGVIKEIGKLESERSSHSLLELSDTDRIRALKELKVLQDDLQKGMPTWDQYVSLTPKHGPRYTALVRQIVLWESDPIRRQKVQRWKTLRRLVDPQDEQAANVMYLFPQ